MTILRTAKRAGAACGVLAMALAWPSLSFAFDVLVVPDASAIKYAVDPTGIVYFRNLNEVDSTWAGCCGNFWINLNTEGGRGMYSSFLTARASHQRFVIVAPTKAGSQSDQLLQVGDF